MTYEVWIHIDHIDNVGHKVWAVQIPSKKKYIVCHAYKCFVPTESAPFREGKQPRAYITCRGKVKVSKEKGKVTVYIYD